MAKFSVLLENTLSPKEIRALDLELTHFNAQRVPPDGKRALYVTARDENWELLGGLTAYTHWNWLYISQIWVDEPLRGKGIGQQLVTAAEEEALKRGCRHAHLNTYDFQARGFYEKLGYTVFGILDDYPPGHQRLFLKKDL